MDSVDEHIWIVRIVKKWKKLFPIFPKRVDLQGWSIFFSKRMNATGKIIRQTKVSLMKLKRMQKNYYTKKKPIFGQVFLTLTFV